MKNIVLIGMMGSAKSTTGKIIAKKLNRPFFDGDDVYVSVYGEKIADTFATLGEEEFRKRETEIARLLGALDGAVVACGGGVVLREENMTALKSNGIIVRLTATPETIYERVSRNDRRPLLKEGGIEKVRSIMAEREPLYRKYADFSVDNSYSRPAVTADRVILLYNKMTAGKR